MKPKCKTCNNQREKKSVYCRECDLKLYPKTCNEENTDERCNSAYVEALELGREYRNAKINGFV